MIDIGTGTRIDGFTVGACIHSGGMARLFEVTGGSAGFPLLMKVPRLGDPAVSAEMLLSFETEAMILPRLYGPHVPRFVRAGDVTTAPYLVTERIAGAGPDRRPARALPPDEAARMGADICTCPPAVIDQLFNHPLTNIGLEKFLKDWETSQAVKA